MARLQGDKAFCSNEIQELMNVGRKTLETAQDVSEDVKKCLAEITAQLEKIPAGVREGGAERAADDLEKIIRKGDYSREKTRLQNALKKLETAVPRYDQKCASQMQQLGAACDRIYTRITDLEQFLQKGKADLPSGKFQEELEKCRKVWEEEGAELGKLLEAVKAGLKGLELASCQYSSDPVNLSTGNFIYDKTDLEIKGEPGLSFRRFYNALEQKKGVMGSGWMHNYEVHLLEGEKGVHVFLEDGKEECYEKDGEGNLKSLRGNLGILTETGEGWLYEKTDGSRYRFDGKGRYIRYEDSRGRGLVLSYDEDGKPVRVQEEAGENAVFLSYAYDEEGHLIRVSDHTGRSIRLFYREGELGRVEAMEGTCYDYRYDSIGKLSQVANAAGTVTVKNIYDGEGRTKRQIFPDGSRMKYRYMEETGQVELTERNGAKTIYCHDSLYRNTKTIYENGEESWTYNRNNQVISHTDPNGNRTVYAYDGWGNLTKVTDALGNTTMMLYNGRGKLIRLSVNGEEKIRNHYDSRGNLVSTTDAEGNTTRFSYGEKDCLACIVQADGSEINITYDEKGNITAVRDAGGAETRYVYDALNRVTESRDGNGNTTRYCYNEKDELISVTNAEGNTRTYTYNQSGKVTKVVDFDGSSTEFSYNVLNRVEQATDAEGNRTRYGYDRMWNVSQVEDAAGGKTEYHYNLQNLLETVIDAEGGRVSYSYDACGNRTRVQGTGGEETLSAYDAVNRLVKLTEPDGVVTEYVYDASGNLAEARDSLGNLRKLEYDGNGRCITETDRKGRTTRYEYDAMGNTVCVTDTAGRKTEYIYRKGGLLEQVVYPDGTWERYEHDGCRNVIRRERADGYAVDYAYDCMNRLVRMESSTGQKKCFRYDAAGNVTGVTDANGNETAYRYDRTGNLTGVTDAEGGVSACRYDAAGRLEEIRQLPGAGRTEEGVQHAIRYTRDLLGRITGTTDALGRTETFAYDASGRLAEKKDRDGYVTAYGYTVNGQPERITYGDGKEVRFAYEGYTEYTIQGCEYNGELYKNTTGTGRADIVLINGNTAEVYEIKPYLGIEKGKEQLNAYVQGINSTTLYKAVKGTSFNPNGLVLDYPANPKKEIVYYTNYNASKGIIRYYVRNRKEEDRPKLRVWGKKYNSNSKNETRESKTQEIAEQDEDIAAIVGLIAFVIFGVANDAVGFVADDVAVASACIALVAILRNKIDTLFKDKEECES